MGNEVLVTCEKCDTPRPNAPAQCKECKRRYNKSTSGVAALQKYRKSAKGKLAQQRWNSSPTTKAAQTAWKYTTKGRSSRREGHLRLRYGITLGEYEALLQKQGGRCAICAKDKPGRGGVFHVDHDHQTNRIRGLLCAKCNLALGGFDDDPWLLERAVVYLKAEVS